jgi:hypothetical protein
MFYATYSMFWGFFPKAVTNMPGDDDYGFFVQLYEDVDGVPTYTGIIFESVFSARTSRAQETASFRRCARLTLIQGTRAIISPSTYSEDISCRT